jgi:hypothetical protein
MLTDREARYAGGNTGPARANGGSVESPMTPDDATVHARPEWTLRGASLPATR